MSAIRGKAVAIAMGFGLFGAASALAFNLEMPAGAPASVRMTVDGPVLVTPTGMTLYLNSNENTRSERFAWECTDAPAPLAGGQLLGAHPQIGHRYLKSCAQKYPPFLADADAKPIGDFTIHKRPDGSRQWAYRGLAMYTSSRDRKPGDRNAAGANNFRGGIRLATMAMTLPTGLKFARRADGLVVATTENDRPVYTPRQGSRVLLATAGGEEFKFIAAPAIASVDGDWSIVQAGAGLKQYAFRGKPLYRAPAGVSDAEIIAAGWEPVVVHEAPPRPDAIGVGMTLLGEVYTDKKGMTLYSYNCTAGGRQGRVGVSCDDVGDPAAWMVAVCGDGKECARRWRPYIASAKARPQGDFSIVDITYPMFTDMRGTLYPANAPSVKAWAYRGKPLYTYYEDERPGHMWGDNVGGLWGSIFNAVQVPGMSAIQIEP